MKFILAIIIVPTMFVNMILANTSTANMYLDIRGSTFKPSIKNFSTVYPDNSFFPTICLGAGANNIYLNLRYEKYSTIGESQIDGADITGKAEWEQTFLSAGIRAFTTEGVYIDMGYLLTSLQEVIGTYKDQYPALNRSYKADQIPGFNIGIGFFIPVNQKVRLSGEGNYKHIDLEKTDPDMNNLQPGGIGFSLGLIIFLK